MYMKQGKILSVTQAKHGAERGCNEGTTSLEAENTRRNNAMNVINAKDVRVVITGGRPDI